MPAHMHVTSPLFTGGGYVGTPEQQPTLQHSWFDAAANIPANFMSLVAAPNPGLIAQTLPRPVSIVSNAYGLLPPVSQAPLGTNTRI